MSELLLLFLILIVWGVFFAYLGIDSWYHRALAREMETHENQVFAVVSNMSDEDWATLQALDFPADRS